MVRLVSIDIGSTYTKGACFELEAGRLLVKAYAKTPTTVAHLKEGFDTVRCALEAEGPADRIAFSSSARGGLAIAAIGLVPELTLKIARMAALSAGGKVASVHAYKLLPAQVGDLAAARPDIILLAGGTDGGNETYVRHNLDQLVGMPQHLEPEALPTVIYAGNAVLQEEVRGRLQAVGFDVAIAPNLMPQMDQVEPEGARAAIRDVFLRKIVHGKGLDEIIASVGTEPAPTPWAMLRLVEAIRRRAPEFGDFLVVDMGGATTDVYSAAEGFVANDKVVLRGVPEPAVKRTVEGDLGMRVSAQVAGQATEATLATLMGAEVLPDLHRYLERVVQAPDHLPTDPEGLAYDAALASACIHHALLRHAGTWRRVFTAAGETFLQSGKDLRAVTRVVGSGGYLSALETFHPRPLPMPAGEHLPLVPTAYTYHRDAGYFWPLLGSLVPHCEAEAVAFALDHLQTPA